MRRLRGPYSGGTRVSRGLSIHGGLGVDGALAGSTGGVAPHDMATKLEKTTTPGIFRRHATACERGRCSCPYVVVWRHRGKQTPTPSDAGRGARGEGRSRVGRPSTRGPGHLRGVLRGVDREVRRSEGVGILGEGEPGSTDARSRSKPLPAVAGGRSRWSSRPTCATCSGRGVNRATRRRRSGSFAWRCRRSLRRR